MNFTFIYYNNEQKGPMKSDNIKWMIAFSVITLSGFHSCKNKVFYLCNDSSIFCN